MDKLRSILSSSTNRKVGPPVPPRPPKTIVQRALEQTRNQSPNFPQVDAVPIAKGRTVIYTSTDNNSQHHKCFDTKSHDSSVTGLKVNIATQNGNTARAIAPTNKESTTTTPVMHYKSPVPRPRLKTPPLPPSPRSSSSTSSTPPPLLANNPLEFNFRQQQKTNSSYSKLLMQNQNTDNGNNIKRNASRDDELKEKLLNEIFSGRLVETSNVHLRYNGSNLKRSSSCDVLNDRNSIVEMSPPTPQEKMQKDRKVAFHEILISELSEMRRENHRLSAAKSCSDLSPSGHKQVMNIIDIGGDITSTNTYLISLEDSGVEDEEKPDDCSSSGVGDSWDSCKEMHNRINMSLPGLPPLPKSLSGLELSQHQPNQQQQNISKKILTPIMPQSKDIALDNKLAILRREMYSLRQLDLSLLSQLWALNESIQEFRTMMQEQQENFLQQSPSPSNSDLNSLVSDDDTNCDENITIIKSQPITELPLKRDKPGNIKRMNILPPAPPFASNC